MKYTIAICMLFSIVACKKQDQAFNDVRDALQRDSVQFRGGEGDDPDPPCLPSAVQSDMCDWGNVYRQNNTIPFSVDMGNNDLYFYDIRFTNGFNVVTISGGPCLQRKYNKVSVPNLSNAGWQVDIRLTHACDRDLTPVANIDFCGSLSHQAFNIDVITAVWQTLSFPKRNGRFPGTSCYTEDFLFWPWPVCPLSSNLCSVSQTATNGGLWVKYDTYNIYECNSGSNEVLSNGFSGQRSGTANWTADIFGYYLEAGWNPAIIHKRKIVYNIKSTGDCTANLAINNGNTGVENIPVSAGQTLTFTRIITGNGCGWTL